MTNIEGARVWYDNNTGRLQVTVPVPPHMPRPQAKAVIVRFEYPGTTSHVEQLIRVPRNRDQ